MRRLFVLAALLAATCATAQTKVSGGGTPPAADQTAPAPDKNQAAPEGNRRDAARKALGAIKGGPAKDKREAGADPKAGR